MSNDTGQFGFDLYQMKAGDLPFHPLVHLTFQNTHTSQKSGFPAIGATLTASEIDWEIDHLKKQLDTLAKKAKAALQKAEEKTKEITEAKAKNAD